MKINPEGYFPQLPIKWQLIIGLSVLGFVIISIIGTATILFDMSRIDQRVEQASHHQTELVAKLALDSLIDKDRPTLQTMVDGLKDLDNGLVKIELSDQDGNILALWVDADTDEDLVSSSETIVYKGQEFGILSMAWTRDHFAKPILAAKTHSILTAFVAFGFLILSLGAVLQWYLVVPLQYLEKKVRAVADESAYTETMPSIIPRELRGLDESLDQTARALVEKAQAESKVLDERSRAETAEAAAKARMDFLSLMSHEIRTPLGAMIGFGRLLKTAKLDAEERSILDNLNSSGRFLLRIINDILDLSKIEANGIQLEARPLNPVSVIVELEKMVQPLAQARGIGLEFSSSGLGGKQISADPHRLKQILMNLVGNAVKFTEDGTVTVSADAIGFGKNDQDEDTVTIRFEVSDTGIGMSAEQCSQIFDPFAQADSGITRRFGGTGLGLSIASQLAAKMDGAITVESEVNRGSTFRFEATFLVSEACDLELPKPEESEPDAYMADTSLRILIAEDETVNRILIEKIFASIGHKVEFVEDGQACFERLQQGIDFDALFLDLHMPHIGGFEIARKLRAGEFGEAGKQVNLVIMSADVLAEEEGQSIGVDAFISKPIDPSLLQSFLHSISADHSEIPIPPLPDDEFAVAVSKIGTARRENEMKVLVVEDQKLYRELMNQLLKRIGLDVSFAEDGIECLEFLEGEPDLDAIFLDLRMPRMGGKAVAKKIRDGDLGECYTDIPIAVVSAEELDVGDFEEIGANQFIAKPIDLELLKSFVERVRSDHSAVVLPG